MKNVLVLAIMCFMATGAFAQKVDTRTIPDILPITGVISYDQVIAAHRFLKEGVLADVIIQDPVTGTYTLMFNEHNVKITKVRKENLTEANVEKATISHDKRNVNSYCPGVSVCTQQQLSQGVNSFHNHAVNNSPERRSRAPKWQQEMEKTFRIMQIVAGGPNSPYNY